MITLGRKASGKIGIKLSVQKKPAGIPSLGARKNAYRIPSVHEIDLNKYKTAGTGQHLFFICFLFVYWQVSIWNANIGLIISFFAAVDCWEARLK